MLLKLASDALLCAVTDGLCDTDCVGEELCEIRALSEAIEREGDSVATEALLLGDTLLLVDGKGEKEMLGEALALRLAMDALALPVDLPLCDATEALALPEDLSLCEAEEEGLAESESIDVLGEGERSPVREAIDALAEAQPL